ncbi:MAG TPA: hypothetical protein VM577_21055 [Anaerovoracaceae bacterium]|nr:hypothetical protein [Anaerovoracaceae bacterium]
MKSTGNTTAAITKKIAELNKELRALRRKYEKQDPVGYAEFLREQELAKLNKPKKPTSRELRDQLQKHLNRSNRVKAT